MKNPKKLKKSFEIFRKNWKIRALEKSQVFSFFASRYVRVLFKNQRKSEKLWGKPWEFKKRIGEQFRKTVRKWVLRKNLPFSHPRPKTYRKSEKMFEEILKKFLKKSEKISKKIWEIFLPGTSTLNCILFIFFILLYYHHYQKNCVFLF